MRVKVSQSDSTVTCLMYAMAETVSRQTLHRHRTALRHGISQSCNSRLCLRHVHTHAPYPLFYWYSNYFASYVAYISTYHSSFFDEEYPSPGHHTAYLSLTGYTFSIRGFDTLIHSYCLTLIYLAYVNSYVLISTETPLPVCTLPPPPPSSSSSSSSSSERSHSFSHWLQVFPIREYHYINTHLLAWCTDLISISQ